MTPQEVADILGVSKRVAVDELVRTGLYFWVGKRRRVTQDQLESLIRIKTASPCPSDSSSEEPDSTYTARITGSRYVEVREQIIARQRKRSGKR